MFTNVDVDKFVWVDLSSVNSLSNLSRIYSHFKNSEIRKPFLRGTLESFADLKVFDAV